MIDTKTVGTLRLENWRRGSPATAVRGSAVFNALPTGLLYGENCGDRTGIDGNLNASPLFVNTNDDFHLRSDSPLIDAGTSSGAPLVDFDQDIRPNDGDFDGTASVDIGADEWTIPDTGVTGTVTDENSDPLGGLCARAWEGAFGKGAAGTRADGRYWIPLAAGSYSVEFWDCVAQVYDTQWYDNVPDKASATPVVVASGSLAEIDAGMSLTGISGVVTNGSTIPLPDVCVTVYDGAAALGNATTNSDGEYLALVPPGSYTTHFVECEGGLYEAEWYDDAPDQASASPAVVAWGVVTGGVDAVLDLTGIAGSVTNDGGSPLPDICVTAYSGATPAAICGYRWRRRIHGWCPPRLVHGLLQRV